VQGPPMGGMVARVGRHHIAVLAVPRRLAVQGHLLLVHLLLMPRGVAWVLLRLERCQLAHGVAMAPHLVLASRPMLLSIGMRQQEKART